MYLITKLQNQKAIHNSQSGKAWQKRLYLITKLQNLKAIHNITPNDLFRESLYLITKLQNLKAIHNRARVGEKVKIVVSNYKITKSESYSQQPDRWH